MDFANILFGGPCNRSCPFCIGKQLPAALQANNLDRYPLLGQQQFVDAVLERDIGQVVMTGTVTDPQLYRHEARLLDELRRQLPGRQFSLHTNGVLALRKMDEFNAYDRVCLSFPSFRSETYQRLMGSARVPDLAQIVARARVPVKVSCVLTPDNLPELEEFLEGCSALGIRRLVLRQLFLPSGETVAWELPRGLTLQGYYRANPVYAWKAMEVTCWDFRKSESQSLNLFPNGTLSARYLLSEAEVS